MTLQQELISNIVTDTGNYVTLVSDQWYRISCHIVWKYCTAVRGWTFQISFTIQMDVLDEREILA